MDTHDVRHSHLLYGFNSIRIRSDHDDDNKLFNGSTLDDDNLIVSDNKWNVVAAYFKAESQVTCLLIVYLMRTFIVGSY